MVPDEVEVEPIELAKAGGNLPGQVVVLEVDPEAVLLGGVVEEVVGDWARQALVLEVHLLDGTEVGQGGEGAGDALPLGLAAGALDGQYLQLGQVVEGVGQGAAEGVLAEGQNAQVGQLPDLLGDLARQVVLI